MPLSFDDLIPAQGRTGMFDDIPDLPAAPKLVGKRVENAPPNVFDQFATRLHKALLGDVAKSAGIGLARGAIGLAGR
jgi:hypothetical protein